MSLNNEIWRNFINKPKLNNYVSSTAEVSYNQYGPTFALAGTMTALNAVVLVHTIAIEVTTVLSKKYRYLEWFAFRSPQSPMGKFSELGLTMTSKFTISPNTGFDYNIIFADNSRYSEMKPLLKAVKDAWESARNNTQKAGQKVTDEELYGEFVKTKLVIDAIERLKKLSTWEAGVYNLKLRVTTNKPKQIFDTPKTFTLTEEQSKQLSENAALIVADICQQPKIEYYCATPELK